MGGRGKGKGEEKGGKEPHCFLDKLNPGIREGDDRICLLLNLGLATPLKTMES